MVQQQRRFGFSIVFRYGPTVRGVNGRNQLFSILRSGGRVKGFWSRRNVGNAVGCTTNVVFCFSPFFPKVVPIYHSSGIMSRDETREVIPDVYNWDTLPCFRNNRISYSGKCRGIEDYYGFDENYFGDTSFIVLCLLVIILVTGVVLYSCFTCQHRPGCHNLKNNGKSYNKTSDTSSGSIGRYKKKGDNYTL